MTASRSAPVVPVRIWDLPTRVFHWCLVGSIAVALYTGFLAPDSWLGIHKLSGYIVTALIVFRLVWWAYGFDYSRLSSLIAALRGLPQFIPALLRLRPPHVAGHNPAGSAMIVALMAVITFIIATGFVTEGGYERQGVLAGVLEFATGAAAREIHETAALLLLGMIALHVAGVAVETLLLRAPLVRGMITGRLPLPSGLARAHPQPAEPGRAVVAMAVIALAAGGAGYGLLQLPVRGMPAMPSQPQFEKECSACHMLYHPSLLPRASWTEMMQRLDDHFGEDASLDPKTSEAIAAHLDAYASEAWDTQAANLLRRTSASDPLRITASPYWVRKHSGIPAATFAAAAVRSKANCAACHRDAATGRFDDQAISMPSPKL